MGTILLFRGDPASFPLPRWAAASLDPPPLPRTPFARPREPPPQKKRTEIEDRLLTSPRLDNPPGTPLTRPVT